VKHFATAIFVFFHIHVSLVTCPGRIKFKLAVIVYRALHGSAPCYLSGMLRRVADIPSRGGLPSSSTSQLMVRPSCFATAGERSFASAGPRPWNNLSDITTAPSLPAFRRTLKTHLFRQSYVDVIVVCGHSGFFYLGYLKNILMYGNSSTLECREPVSNMLAYC